MDHPATFCIAPPYAGGSISLRISDERRQVPSVQPNSAHTLMPDPPAFRTVFDHELAFVWNTLKRFGVAERDLEDVTHETFVVVARLLPTYDPARPIRPWLFAIAVRCASDYRKRSHNRHETLASPDIDPADPKTGVDDVLAFHQEQNLARRALFAVPEERRAVVLLHDFEETAMQDIADALAVPLKTAYSRLRLGREELIAAAKRLHKGER